MTAPPLGYLPALDGVRAIAVGLVMLGHLAPGSFPGGHLGVDVFFALSGFLITTLLLEEANAQHGEVGLRKFYARRALRLFPALYTMLAALLVYVWIRWDALPGFVGRAGLVGDHVRRDFLGFIAGAATYTTDIFGLEQRRGNIVGHTWSLGVEEQFYLLWPIVLIGVLRYRRQVWAISVLWGLVVAVGVIRLFDVETVRVLSYRAEAIAAGTAVALLRHRSDSFRHWFERHGAVVGPTSLGVVLVFAAGRGRGISAEFLARVGYSVVGVASAALVMSLVSAPASPLVKALGFRPLVWGGLISYGLYIWHFPVFRIVGWERPAWSLAVQGMVKVALTFAISIACYRLVEKPARRAQARFRPGVDRVI